MNMAATPIELAEKVSNILNFDPLRKDCKIEVSYPKNNGNEIDYSEIVVAAKFIGGPTNIANVARALESCKINIIANTADALMALGYQVEYVKKTHEELKQQYEAKLKEGFISVSYIAKKA